MREAERSQAPVVAGSQPESSRRCRIAMGAVVARTTLASEYTKPVRAGKGSVHVLASHMPHSRNAEAREEAALEELLSRRSTGPFSYSIHWH